MCGVSDTAYVYLRFDDAEIFQPSQDLIDVLITIDGSGENRTAFRWVNSEFR